MELQIVFGVLIKLIVMVLFSSFILKNQLLSLVLLMLSLPIQVPLVELFSISIQMDLL